MRVLKLKQLVSYMGMGVSDLQITDLNGARSERWNQKTKK
jgi:hypothetical protein